MNVLFESSFFRDLKRVKDRRLRQKVWKIIEDVKAAPDLRHIPNLTKLRGHADYYRIRVGEYRIGLEIVGDTVIFVRFLHRRDLYRYFP